jgi:putative nucleotidyltransferase with HDIG domain
MTSDQYIDRVSQLPPAPTIVTKLLSLFGDPDRDLDAIVELLNHDASLTAEILKRCNSASLSGSEPIADMFEAVTRLGFYEIYRLVTASVGARTLSIGKGKSGLDTGGLWRHSVITAVAAETLAKRVEEVEAVAFTAGLLHDIGKLVFASVEGPRYAEILKQTSGIGAKLSGAEQAAFGVSHASVGARLLVRWNLPENVTVAGLHHHDLLSGAEKFQRLAAIVHLANNLAHHIVDRKPPTSDLLSTHAEAMTLLQVTPEDMPKLIVQTQTGLQRVEGLLQMAA